MPESNSGLQGNKYSGYWQLSRRVHNRKGFELNGMNHCIEIHRHKNQPHLIIIKTKYNPFRN